MFPFDLDKFQKDSIKHIHNNENVLVTAPTGSGKSVCAIAAIVHHMQQTPNQKIIYTSPIKALSNQKYHKFKHKLKSIATIGIITGNKKIGTQNDVLIMTAEILRNKLYYPVSVSTHNLHNNDAPAMTLDFNIDKDVSCIIMDEIHFIHDTARGHVWEETLLLLPSNVKLVLLSATLKHPNRLIDWLGNINKPCHLITSYNRVVPLRHYFYVHFTQFNKIQDTQSKAKCRKLCNKMISTHKYDDIHNIMNIIQHLNTTKKKPDSNNDSKKSNKIQKRKHNNKNDLKCIEGVLYYLKQKKQFPALFFVFSRKLCEQYALKIDRNYTNNRKENAKTSMINSQVYRLTRDLLHQKIRNIYQRNLFLLSSEFKRCVELWCKGIAYHHAGMHTIYRELVEILFNKNYINVLFATETFAVGLNSPIKTVVFTKLQKYRSKNDQSITKDDLWLTKEEYMQMAGRAGRRGIDEYGNVIILPINLSLLPPKNTIKRYHDNATTSSNHSSEIDLQPYKVSYNTILGLIEQQYDLETLQNTTYSYLDNSAISEMLHQLLNIKYIKRSPQHLQVTLKGKIAAMITQVNELVLTEIILNDQYWSMLDSAELCVVLAYLFQSKRHYINHEMLCSIPTKLLTIMDTIKDLTCTLENNMDSKQSSLNTHLDISWVLNEDTLMLSYVYMWSHNESLSYNELFGHTTPQTTSETHKRISRRLCKAKGSLGEPYIQVGDFVKQILQLSNLIDTIIKICRMIENHKLLSKLQYCNGILLRDIVITNSLYI